MPALLIKRINIRFHMIHALFRAKLQYFPDAASADMAVLILFAYNDSRF